VLLVTPGLAAAWLACQPAGRISEGLPGELRVARIAADIAAGRWRSWQGRPASLNAWGLPGKGLHRLHAIVRAGQPVLLRAEGAVLHARVELAAAIEALRIERS
jgi:hypothetical protein